MPITLEEARRRRMWAVETTYPSGRVAASAYTPSSKTAVAAVNAASKPPGVTMKAVPARKHRPIEPSIAG